MRPSSSGAGPTRRVPPQLLVQAVNRFRGLLAAARRRSAPPAVGVLENLYGIMGNKLLGIAAELELPDHLHSGPKTVDELVRATGANADALHRVLRTMVGLGFFARTRDGRFKNNAFSEVLRKDHPDSVRDFVRFFASDWLWDIWNRAPHTVRTGESAALAALGMPFFDMLRDHPDRGRIFDGAMRSASKINAPILPLKYDFSTARKVCDLGGGTGTNLAEVLARNPHLKGVLFDLPDVVATASAVLDLYGVADRVECVGGDFFESVPEGCDVYMLQAILHGCDDEQAAQILTHIRTAMHEGGRVLILEMLMPEDDRDHPAKWLDMQMLIGSGGGRERTRVEFEALARRAGFGVSRIIPLPTFLCITELVPETTR